eukprot:UN26328
MNWPKRMTIYDMNRICDDFINAALLCKNSGFDAIELHCGHGYLLSQFYVLLQIQGLMNMEVAYVQD